MKPPTLLEDVAILLLVVLACLLALFDYGLLYAGFHVAQPLLFRAIP